MARLRVMSAKIILVGLAVGVGLAQTILAWERGLPPTEVLAPFLYIPVLAAAVLGGWTPGLIAAALVSMVYGAALQDQSKTVGFGLMAGLFVDRAATYALYAVAAAFVSGYVERRLWKLERVDRVDDATGLGNAAEFVEACELEMKRADRYGSTFSLAEVRLDAEVLDAQNRRRRAKTLLTIGTTLAASTRRVDRAARVTSHDAEQFVIILPETGEDGSNILAGRLDTAVRTALAGCSVEANGQLSVHTLSYPGDRDEIERLREAAIPLGAGDDARARAEATQ